MLTDRDMGCGPSGSPSQAVWAPMATIQAAIYWTMLALTPSMVLVAVLLMRTGLSDDQEPEFRDLHLSQLLEFDDQPYPDAEQPNPAAH